MFKNAIRLPFRLFGIPIQLDLSFLIFLPILAWMIGRNVAPISSMLGLEIDPADLTTGSRPLLLGAAAAVGLFFSVLVHEVGHSVVALRQDVKVQSITLWLLGGIAQFERMPRRRGVEAIIAIAGPITSLLLGGVFWIVLQLVPPVPGSVFLLSYLFFMNWFLAIFNLLPAIPLDGGRVLRSLLALKMSYRAATDLSVSISRVFAFLLGFLGFVNLNIVLLLIAFFVYAAGRGEAAVAAVQDILGKLTVADLMSREVETVPAEMPIAVLMDKMLQDRYLGYPVVDPSGRLRGMISLDDVKRHRTRTEPAVEIRVADFMQSPPQTLAESQSAVDAFEQITQKGIDRLPVLDRSDHLVGIISKTDLVRAVRVKMIGGAFWPGEKGGNGRP